MGKVSDDVATTSKKLFRAEEKKSELLVCYLRSGLALLLIIINITIRDQIYRRSSLIIYLVCGFAVVYSAIVSYYVYRGHYKPWIKYFSTFLDLMMVSVVLMNAGTYRTFKSSAFLVYFIVVGLAGMRFSTKLVVFSGITGAVLYTVLIVLAVMRGTIATGTIQESFITSKVSLMSAVVNMLIFGFFSLALSSIARGYHRIVNRSVENELQVAALEKELRQVHKMEAIGALAGGIAHDFNNVLYPILGYSESSLELVPHGDKVYNNLKEIHFAASRAQHLVKQILDFSRETDGTTIPMRVQPIILEVVQLIRPTLPSTIDIGMEIDDRCGPVIADPTQIHQILLNLCTNAYQAMKNGQGLLRITLAEEDFGEDIPQRCVCLSVSDTGQGILPEDMEKIFDPYFTTKAPGEGTGMGLSTVYGLVKALNGEIRVTSEVGKGSRFTVYLPQASRVEAEPYTPPEVSQKPVIGGAERILYVDDETHLVPMVTEVLQRLGYFVVAFTDSQEAWKTFAMGPERFDLVITDLTMPELTGIELAERMLGVRPDLPIIICTGYSDLFDEQAISQSGVIMHVNKPISNADLARVIRTALDRN